MLPVTLRTSVPWPWRRSRADLIEPALELALAYDITVYDGSFAVLAQQLNLPLITADDALGRKLSGSGVAVQLLAE